MNPQIKEVASHLAQSWGCATLVPDLYRGQVATDHEHAGHLMNGLNWPGAVEDVRAAAIWLQQKGGYKKVGVMGFCMGGALTVASSVLIPEIAAASAFYGICPKALANPALAKAPIQLHFAEKVSFHFEIVFISTSFFIYASWLGVNQDEYKGFADIPSARALAATLTTARATHELHEYVYYLINFNSKPKCCLIYRFV